MTRTSDEGAHQVTVAAGAQPANGCCAFVKVAVAPPDGTVVCVDRAPVMHVDVDAFFASASLRDRPELAHLPVAIAHDHPRAVVTTANYPARKFGVGSAMPVWQAKRRCPTLILIEPDFELYRQLSAPVAAAVADVADTADRIALDEVYANLDALHCRNPAAAAMQVRVRVFDATSLTVSVGVAATRVAAKLASEHAKPDGLYVCEPDTEATFVAGHPVTALPGWGPATAMRCQHLGIETIGDVAVVDAAVLAQLIGVTHAARLQSAARNDFDTGVTFPGPASSISHETTLAEDVFDDDTLRHLLDAALDELVERVHQQHVAVGGVTVKLKDRLFVERSRAMKAPQPTADPAKLREIAHLLLEALGTHAANGVRLIGVSATGLHTSEQLDLFSDPVNVAGQAPLTVGAVVSHSVFGDGVVFDLYHPEAVVRFSDRARVVESKLLTDTQRRVTSWAQFQRSSIGAD